MSCIAKSVHDDAEGELQRQLVKEVQKLRAELCSREHEARVLQTQVTALTSQLAETSGELERRMDFVAEAMTQIGALETQLAEAKRCKLTWEMKMQEGEDRRRTLETALDAKEEQRERWERECRRLQRDASLHEQAQADQSAETTRKSEDARMWKTKLKAVTAFAEKVKQKNAEHRKRERELANALQQSEKAAKAAEQAWELQLAEKTQTILGLEQQRCTLQEHVDRAERNRVKDDQAREKQQQLVTEQQLCDHKQVILLRERVVKLAAIAEKAQVKEQLLRREVFRLREELLLSESRRETEQRRQEELVEGKQKEVTFIWQKYTELVSTAESARLH